MYAYVIAKDSTEESFNLYEHNFDDVSNGQLPEGFEVISGNPRVDNGKLIVNAGSMVMLPEYLKGLSNYIIETDFTIKEANEGTRWASVIFRYSTNNYFQMAIRQGASKANGVEFAKMINGTWNVPSTIGYKEDIDPNKTYRLKIEVFQGLVKEYIDDELLIEYNQAWDYQHGSIGFQANGAIAEYDNVKVTMPKEYNVKPKIQLPSIAEVYNPVTKIVNAPTILTRLNSKEEISSYIGNKRPATLILKMNQDLEILDKNNVKIDTLEEILKLLKGQIIPALETEDVKVAKLFAKELMEYSIMDLAIISSNQEVITEARKINQMVRGILKIDEIPEVVHDIRVRVNKAQANAVLLPASKINKELVHYLQHRIVSVFSETTNLIEREMALLSGVNGILTDEPLELITRYEEFVNITHIREVFFIAHRGLHNGYTGSVGPENSLEVAEHTLEAGVKILETDVHLTKDGELVVMHDNTTNRTADIGLVVKDTDLHYLTSLTLKDISNTGKTFKIPSLNQYLDAFKGKDVVLFVEVKPTDEQLLIKLHETLEEKQMFDQVVLIMFGAQNAVYQQTVSPGMSNGHLVGGMITADVQQTVKNVLLDVIPIKTTFNPNYPGLNDEIVKGLSHRGVTTWPWTVDGLSDMKHLYEVGVGGITTNNYDLIKDSLLNLEYQRTNFKFSLETKQKVSISGKLMAHDNASYNFKGELILIDDGGTDIKLNQNSEIIDAEKGGTAYFYSVAKVEFPDGTIYDVTSPMLTVDVSEKIYNVKFLDDNNATLYEDQKVSSGSKVVKPKDPQKKDFKFDGWKIENTNDLFDFDTVLDKDAIYEIKFRAKADEARSMQFNLEGGGMPNFVQYFQLTNEWAEYVIKYQHTHDTRENVKFAFFLRQMLGSSVNTKVYLDDVEIQTIETYEDDIKPFVFAPEVLIVKQGSVLDLKKGIVAWDNHDGFLNSEDIIVNGTVDTSTIGDYPIGFTIKDAAYNESVEVFTMVKVVAEADFKGKPVELINGDFSVAQSDPIPQPAETGWD